MALNRNQSAIIAAAGIGAVGALAFYYRKQLGQLLAFGQPVITPEVEAKLPIAKDLKTVTDHDGNYDLDGVSYDVEGVIVSSDDNKDLRPNF